MKETITASDPHRFLIIGSSPRKNGNTDLICGAVKNIFDEKGFDSRIIRLSALKFSPCTGCESCRKTGKCVLKDDLTPVYPLIQEAKGVFLVSPVHHYNITAWMKAFIDRMYCFYHFDEPRPGPWYSRLSDAGRTAVCIAPAEQPDPKYAEFTLKAMSEPLKDLGYYVIDEIPASGVFEKGEINRHSKTLSKIIKTAETMTESS